MTAPSCPDKYGIIMWQIWDHNDCPLLSWQIWDHNDSNAEDENADNFQTAPLSIMLRVHNGKSLCLEVTMPKKNCWRGWGEGESNNKEEDSHKFYSLKCFWLFLFWSSLYSLLPSHHQVWTCWKIFNPVIKCSSSEVYTQALKMNASVLQMRPV